MDARVYLSDSNHVNGPLPAAEIDPRVSTILIWQVNERNRLLTTVICAGNSFWPIIAVVRKLSCTAMIAILAAGLMPCHAQQPSAAPTQDTSLQKLIAALRSENANERSEAYYQLKADHTALLNQPVVRAALVDLLDRESHVELNDDQEGYVEYVSELIDTVTGLVNWNDQHQVCILVRSPYPPGNEIASHAKVAVPCLLQKTQSKESLARGAAVAILVQILGKEREALDSATIQQTRQIVLDALHDGSFYVRASTVEALERFGGQDMIPALERVAETDPTPPGPSGYSIRKLANDAIAAIQNRADQH